MNFRLASGTVHATAIMGVLAAGVALADKYEVERCRELNEKLARTEVDIRFAEAALGDMPLSDDLRVVLDAMDRVLEKTGDDVEAVQDEIMGQVEVLVKLENGLDRITGGALSRIENVRTSMEGLRGTAEKIAGGLETFKEKSDQVREAIETSDHIIDLMEEARAYYGDNRAGLNLSQARKMTEALCTVVDDLKDHFKWTVLDVAGGSCGVALYAIDQAMPVYEALLDRNTQAREAGVPPPYPFALAEPEEIPEEIEARTRILGLANLRQRRGEIAAELAAGCGGIHTSYQGARSVCRREIGSIDSMSLIYDRALRPALRSRATYDRMYSDTRATDDIQRDIDSFGSESVPEALSAELSIAQNRDRDRQGVCDDEANACVARAKYRNTEMDFHECVRDWVFEDAQAGSEAGWAPKNWSGDRIRKHMAAMYDQLGKGYGPQERLDRDQCKATNQECVKAPSILDDGEATTLALPVDPPPTRSSCENAGISGASAHKLFRSYEEWIRGLKFKSSSYMQSRYFGTNVEWECINLLSGFYDRHLAAMVSARNTIRDMDCVSRAHVSHVYAGLQAFNQRHSQICTILDRLSSARTADAEDAVIDGILARLYGVSSVQLITSF